MTARKQPARLIDAVQAARIWRVGPSTWRSYVARGYAPEAVSRGLWDEAEVRMARKSRPGRGARTDRW